MTLRNNSARLTLCAVAGILLLILLLLLLRGCGGSDTSLEAPVIAVPQTAVTSIGPDEDGQQTIMEELNRQAENSRITLSINTQPVFVSGASKGSLWIKNDATNCDDQIVEIIRNDTGDLIYTSDPIPAGKYINTDALDFVLGSGIYPCTAYFKTTDAESGQMTSVGSISITIHVIS